MILLIKIKEIHNNYNDTVVINKLKNTVILLFGMEIK